MDVHYLGYLINSYFLTQSVKQVVQEQGGKKMTIIMSITGLIAFGCFYFCYSVYKNRNDEKISDEVKKSNKKWSVVLFVVGIGFGVLTLSLFLNFMGTPKSKNRWSQLTEKEKENARWAHEVYEELHGDDK